MKRLSIKMRVTAWFTIVMLVIATVMFFLMVENRIRQVTNEAEQSLIKNVTDFSGGMSSKQFMRVVQEDSKTKNAPSDLSEPPPAPEKPDDNFRKPNMYGKGIHYEVYNEDGELIMGKIPFDFEDTQFDDGKVRTVVSESEKYLVYDKKTVMQDGQAVWVKGVTNLSASLNAVNVTKTSDFLIIAALILIAAAGGYLIVKRALAPVQKMSLTAQKISTGNNLSQRIALGEGKDEIYQLANVLDNMLERIECSFESEKQFTSDASHELRTPVAVINSECEYALDCAKTGEEYNESITVIKRQADKMSRLISELLMISRMDKNTLDVNFERVNLSELLEAVCDEQRELHETRLIVEIQKDVSAMADEMLIARLFINLISNAFDYGADGEYVKVCLLKDKENIYFSVEDKGIGIAGDEIERIWERFYQVSKSRNNEKGNMGLGLSMVKEIAQMHKGNLRVESEPGKGSTFYFTMPQNV